MDFTEENREDTRTNPHTETLSGRAYIEELHRTFGKILKPRNKGEVSPKGILKRSIDFRRISMKPISTKPTTITDADRTRVSLLARNLELLNKTTFSKEDRSLYDATMMMINALDATGGADARKIQLAEAERRAGKRTDLTRGLPHVHSDFEYALRHGDQLMSFEKRAQSVGTDTAGGFLVTQQFSDRLYSMLKAVDPLFDDQVVTMVETKTGGPFAIPMLDDTASTAQIIAENALGTVADLGPFSQVTLAKCPTWRTPITKVSLELAGDSAAGRSGRVCGPWRRLTMPVGARHNDDTGRSPWLLDPLPMKFVTARDFAAAKAWDALPIAEIEGATIRLHWTDRPYVWHVNDGAEVFVVLAGDVTMHYRRDGREHRQAMQAGDICHAEPGDEHVAHPVGAARVLVIEKKGSV